MFPVQVLVQAPQVQLQALPVRVQEPLLVQLRVLPVRVLQREPPQLVAHCLGWAQRLPVSALAVQLVPVYWLQL